MKPRILVAAGVVQRDGRILVARRKRGSHLDGRWEFPGGKIEPDESPEDCVARELREELEVTVRVGRILDVVFHRYEDRNVLLLFYACELADGEPRPLECEELAWLEPAELPRLDWAPADREFVSSLAAGRVL